MIRIKNFVSYKIVLLFNFIKKILINQIPLTIKHSMSEVVKRSALLICSISFK